MIIGIVNGQTLRLRYPQLASDTDKYQKAEFRFQGHDWDGADVWAHFWLGEGTHLKVLLENGYAGPEKKLNFTQGVWNVYLEGKLPNGGTITTLIAKMEVGPTGPLTGDGSLPEKPPTEFEQLVQQVKDARTEATQAATDAQSAADSAKGSMDSAGIHAQHAGRDAGMAAEQAQQAENAASTAKAEADRAKKEADRASQGGGAPVDLSVKIDERGHLVMIGAAAPQFSLKEGRLVYG